MKTDHLNPAALHVRIIDERGETEDVCTISDYVKNNEHDAGALLVLGEALGHHGEGQTCDHGAHAWRNLGAGGVVGLVIEDGPVTDSEREPRRGPFLQDVETGRALCPTCLVEELARLSANGRVDFARRVVALPGSACVSCSAVCTDAQQAQGLGPAFGPDSEREPANVPSILQEIIETTARDFGDLDEAKHALADVRALALLALRSIGGVP